MLEIVFTRIIIPIVLVVGMNGLINIIYDSEYKDDKKKGE